MTPCYICGSPISELRLDARDMKTRPCMTCETIINEAATEKIKERREVDDEEFMRTPLEEFLSRKKVYDV